jgi:hypothetical protein
MPKERIEQERIEQEHKERDDKERYCGRCNILLLDKPQVLYTKEFTGRSGDIVVCEDCSIKINEFIPIHGKNTWGGYFYMNNK